MIIKKPEKMEEVIKRKRTIQICLRNDEVTCIEQKARQHGISISCLGRQILLQHLKPESEESFV